MDVEVPGGVETTTDAQINIYTARGTLIESEGKHVHFYVQILGVNKMIGPCWFIGSGAEHSQVYQYQLNNAKNIFMTHIQTETPYYQPIPDATSPYPLGVISGDPDFSECESESACAMAWGLRIIGSQDILIYSAG